MSTKKTPLMVRVSSDLGVGRGSEQFPLRFPDGLRAEIKAAAKANGRSMNAELVARLTSHPQLDRIEAKLGELLAVIRKGGA